MTGEINIDECTEDKKSWFAVKQFKIGGTSFKRPVKTLDIRGLTQDTYRAAESRYGFVLGEATKVFKAADTVDKIQAESVDAKINLFFHKKKWLNIPTVLNMTLNFNPFDHSKQISKTWSGFFDMYYQYSNPFLTIPNIRVSKTVHGKNTKIISIKNYARFVDSAFEMLDMKNSKPIFVPVSLRFSVDSISQLMDHYLSKNRLCLWFDFEGKAVSEVSMSRIAHVLRRLRETENLGRAVTYFTNIKREILSNNKDSKSPASDVLASIAGASIIGVNREPQRPPPGAGLQHVPADHKARLLDPDSYYYVKMQGGSDPNRSHNALTNAVLLDQEFSRQTDSFFQHLSVVPNMKTKEMLRTYRKGDILKALTTGLDDASLTSYL